MAYTKRESAKEPRIVEIHGKRAIFLSGVVERVFTVADYTVIQYSDCNDETLYFAFVMGEVVADAFLSLEAALIGAFTFKYEGDMNTAVRFMRAIGVDSVL